MHSTITAIGDIGSHNASPLLKKKKLSMHFGPLIKEYILNTITHTKNDGSCNTKKT